MLRRPLTIVMIGFVVCIFLWYRQYPPESSFQKVDREARVLGTVENIIEKPSGKSILLSDVRLQSIQQTNIGLQSTQQTGIGLPGISQADKKTQRVQKPEEANQPITCRKIIVYMDKYRSDAESNAAFQSLKIGNTALLEGKVSSFSLPGNPGQFNEFLYYKQQNTDLRLFADKCMLKSSGYSRYKQGLFLLRKHFFHIIQASLPEREAGIIAAMLLGEKSMLSEETKNLYQQNGISHLLAISGLHISIIGNLLFSFLRKRLFSLKVSALLVMFILFSYGILTGFSISAMRAIGMSICMLCGKMMGRAYDMASGLSLVGIITLMLNPMSIFNAGFLLSYSTIIGLLTVLPVLKKLTAGWKRKMPEKKGINAIMESLLGSISIFITTAPILLYFYYEISLYGILVNLLVLPFVTILVGAGFTAGGAGLLSAPIGTFLFGTVHVILIYYDRVANIFAALPYAYIRTGQVELWKIIVYYGILILVCILSLYRENTYAPLLFLLLFLIFLPKKNPDFIFTMLDVGQGDGMYLHAEGTNILVDGGSSSVSEAGKYRLVPFLKWRGVGRIDSIFISHSDVDHINGIKEIIEKKNDFGLEIGCVILPQINKTDMVYQEMEHLCRKAGIRVRKMKQGDEIRIRGIKLSCIHPAADYQWESENHYSLVLKVSYLNLSLLLTGDLEEKEEQMLLERFDDIDILKVGHHGSKSSSSYEFLEKCKPETALISVGEDNRYGHPNEKTLAALEETGADIYSTADYGAVTIRRDETSFSLTSYKEPEGSSQTGKIH